MLGTAGRGCGDLLPLVGVSGNSIGEQGTISAASCDINIIIIIEIGSFSVALTSLEAHYVDKDGLELT